MSRLLKEYHLGDMTARYVTDEKQGETGLVLIPAQNPYPQKVHKDMGIDSMVQLKIVGDTYNGAYAQGMSMRNGESVRSLNYKNQESEWKKDKLYITTYMEDERGYMVKHTLIWQRDTPYVKIFCGFTNHSQKDVRLEMFESFSLSEISPYLEGDGFGKLEVYRIRSVWSQEGRLEHIPVEDLQLEPAWSPHAVRCEKFGQIGSMPVNKFSPFVAFAETYDYIDAYQVSDFLNIDGTEISAGEASLADNVQDNGFSVQSGYFDYLLDLEGNVIHPKEGEVYVPLCYLEDGTIQVKDEINVRGVTLRVAGFLRDSQMNSPMSSSKRFLIHESEYQQLKEYGSEEYLIEFRVTNPDFVRTLEQDYANAGMEANGPAITWFQFRLINALSDGLVIAAILLVSIFLIGIIFMCLRFTLLTQMEEDYREIAVMKAIGLRIRDIKQIYYVKYMLLSGIGCIAGFLLAFPCGKLFTANMDLFMGESGKAGWQIGLGVFGILLIFLLTTAFISKVLNRVKKVSEVPLEGRRAVRINLAAADSTWRKIHIWEAMCTLACRIYWFVRKHF